MNTNSKLFDWYILEANKYFAFFGWGTGSIFSFIGVMAVPHLPWFMYIIAAVFAVGVNVVEAAMGKLTWHEISHPKDANGIVTLIFGLVCYAYDITTNIAGFCYMFTGTPIISVAWSTDKSLLTWPFLLGILFAIGPEPLYRFYLAHTFPKPKRYEPTVTQSQKPQTELRTAASLPKPNKPPYQVTHGTAPSHQTPKFLEGLDEREVADRISELRRTLGKGNLH